MKTKRSKSIIQSEKVCYKTGDTEGLEPHHCIYGNGLRPLADKYGLWVWLRWDWHTYGVSNYSVHHNPEQGLDLELKQLAQKRFEEVHGTREDFMRIFGMNWL